MPIGAHDKMQRSYWMVVISWLVALACLYLFQEYFSVR